MLDKNIYEKLQEARCLLQYEDIKKSGNNSFANYKYFELSDFLPFINDINKKVGLFCQVSFESSDHVKLMIINTQKPEEIISFYSKNVAATIKGAQQIQNLGAEQTYQRRYLYNMAYEIVEGDSIDAGKPNNTSKTNVYKLSSNDLKKLKIHLQTMDTIEEVEESYQSLRKRANGAYIEIFIENVFKDAKDLIIKANKKNKESNVFSNDENKLDDSEVEETIEEQFKNEGE